MTDATSDAYKARLVHGGSGPLPERLAVRAGPLSLVIEAGDVRHVHAGEREVVRRICEICASPTRKPLRPH